MAKITDNSSLKRLRNQYRLVVMNDDTYEEVVTFKLSRLSVYVAMSSIFVLLVSLTVALVVFTPLKFYVPGYGSRQSKSELQLLKYRTDSLEIDIKNKDAYLNSLKNILNEATATKRDTTAIDVPKQDVTHD